MRKAISAFIAVIMMLGMISGNFKDTVEAVDKYIAVNVNGEIGNYEKVNLEVDGKNLEGDMPAILYQKSTMVPVKFIADKIGAETDWKNDLRETTIKKAGKTIKIKIGESKAIVNGVEKTITGGVSPVIGNDRTLLPIRFIAEELGFKVGWDNDTRSALLISESSKLYEVYQEDVLIKALKTKEEAISYAKLYADTKVMYENKEVWNSNSDSKFIEVNINGVSGKYEKVGLKVDNKNIEGDMPAILYKENTMVPIKFVADAIGAETDWKNDIREATIKKSGTTIKVKIGETKATVNGVETPITGGAASVIGNDRTLLPIRFIAETLNFEVGWDNDTRSALLTSKAEIKGDYRVYQNNKLINGFDDQNEAIEYAKQYADTKIAYQGNEIWNFNLYKTGYSVYQGTKYLDLFAKLDNAIAEGLKWSGSVVKSQEKIVWSQSEHFDNYNVYQGTTLLNSFAKLDSAIAEGMKWGDSTVQYKGNVLWSYNANARTYNVYQGSTKLGSFENYYNAISEATKWTGSIINYQGNNVWDFDMYKNGYTVYQEDMNLGSFATEYSATVEAKKWTGSKVMYKGEVVWTNTGNTGGNKKLIVIDPGHGGTDPGTISVTKKREKDLALNVALKLNQELQARGYNTIMTRTTDKTVGLYDRAPIANNANADAFISVHFNSATATSATGLETFYTEKGGNKLTNDEPFARSIQQRMVSATGAVNRGTKKGRLVVTRDTKKYAALVELGFVSNPKDEPTLISDNYHGTVARAIAMGVDDFFK